MTPDTPLHSAAPQADTGLRKMSHQADLVLVAVLVASTAAAFAIGQHYASWDFVSGAAVGMLLALGVAAFAVARGSALSMFALVVANAGMVIMHIQLGRGTLEFHFGIFSLLGLVLTYRDWRAVVTTATLFAVHHVLFDRLQAAGFGFFCTPQPDLLKIVMHAAYVVIQSSVEIVLALQLRRGAVEAAELSQLVQVVKRDDVLHLNVENVRTSAPVATALKGVIGSVAQAVARVIDATHSIEMATKEIAAGNLDLSRRTESQASSLQQTASSMEQLSRTVRQSTEMSSQASRQAAESAGDAAASGHTVQAVVTSMEGIAGYSRKIVDITGLIDGIAFQTNILALNAAVEAARAGEQGRGFAVVATEVRTLAQRSAAAAREIKTLINASVERAESGSRVVEEAGQAMTAVVNNAKKINDYLEEISISSRQQAIGVTEVGKAIQELDRNTQQNAALVEQTSAAAGALAQQADALQGEIANFRVV